MSDARVSFPCGFHRDECFLRALGVVIADVAGREVNMELHMSSLDALVGVMTVLKRNNESSLVDGVRCLLLGSVACISLSSRVLLREGSATVKPTFCCERSLSV